MKDPRFFIVTDGYEIHNFSKYDDTTKHVFELTANNNHLTMVYNSQDDIMTVKGKFEFLHWFLKDLCYSYDLVIS